MPTAGSRTAGIGRAAAALVAVVLATAGCAPSAVTVTPPHPTGAAATACRAVVKDLPRTVVDAEARQVSPGTALAAAWGDPPVVLRCGVGRPAKLRHTSPCAEVNGVGWFAERARRGYIFTTVGRATYVEVSVPAEYEPPGSVLVDLAAAVRKHVPERQPCQ